MKIVHIQASMPPSGNAAYRLSTAMREYGLDSCVLNLYPSAIKKDAYSMKQNVIINIKKFVDGLVKRFNQRHHKRNAYFYTSMPFWGINVSKNELVKNADVIYIHWVAGCLTIKNWNQLANLGKPIIVFMHDMWPFTGGCHHSMGCKKYMFNCGECDMFTCKSSFVSRQFLLKKKLYLQHSNIFFISPSKWMMRLAQMSNTLKESKVFNIPNIIDDRLFKPIDQTKARNELNLPNDKIIIAFGCQAGQKNPFKGWIYLEKAINMVDIDNILILIYGSGYDKETVEKVKYPIHFMGKVEDEKTLSLICNSADIFVTPSLCENYSLAILENLLCGTPVVGFDTTGIPEMVITGKTGYLAKYKDSEDLANGIEKLVYNKLTVNIRDSYSSSNIIRQHFDLIKSITT